MKHPIIQLDLDTETWYSFILEDTTYNLKHPFEGEIELWSSLHNDHRGPQMKTFRNLSQIPVSNPLIKEIIDLIQFDSCEVVVH